MRVCCFFVNKNERGYFSTGPEHDEQKARALIAELGLKYDQTQRTMLNVKWPCSIDPSSADSVLAPNKYFFQLGVYDGGVIYVDTDARGSVERPHATIAQAFIEKFDNSEIFILEMERGGSHGDIDYLAYALYENGKEVRAFVGDDKAHGKPLIKIDRGAPLPEEKPFFERSFVRNGKRMFLHDLTETEYQKMQDILAIEGKQIGPKREVEFDYFYTAGYRLSHSIASRFLGCPLTEFDGKIYLERFHKPKSNKPWWCFWGDTHWGCPTCS